MRNRNFAIISLAFTLSSCATLFNSLEERMDIITTSPAQIVVFQDTFQQVKNRAKIQVPRSLQPLKLTVISGDQSNEFMIPSQSSFMYWSNIFTNYGLGMLIDHDKAQRYSYPSKVYLDPKNTSGTYLLRDTRNRNKEWQLKLGIPYVNTFFLQPDLEIDAKSNTGFWGLSLGLDYYHHSNQYLEFTVSGQSDFLVPVPAAVDIEGEYEIMSSWHWSLSNLYRIKRFSLGYGVSFSRNTWSFRYSSFGDPPPPSRAPISVSNTTFGFNFPIYYHLGNHFYFSALYRPSVWRISTINPRAYEHLISFGFGWEINL